MFSFAFRSRLRLRNHSFVSLQFVQQQFVKLLKAGIRTAPRRHFLYFCGVCSFVLSAGHLSTVALASTSYAKTAATPHHVSLLLTAPLARTKDSLEIRIDTKRPILMLYRNGSLYKRYDVALGKPATPSPVGEWKIVDKQRNWGGGFGTRWLGLNVPWGTYGIHGTNRPDLIGKYVSNGCIRMRNADVEQLYELVPVGTPVIIRGDAMKTRRALVLGNIGADVLLVQHRLQDAGYFPGKCDGRFSGKTQFWLSLYELAHHLPMDGVVGEDDYEALGLT